MLMITADLRPYVAAVAAVLITAALRFMLDPIMGPHMPFYLFYFMVFITAMRGGRGPAMFALSLSAVATTYLFLQPRYELGPLEGESLVQMIRFVSIGGLLVLAGGVVRSLRLRLDEETRERLRTEEMARHAVDNALRVLASVGDGLMTTDDRGRITFMNAVAEELTGWTSSAAQGRHAADVFRIVDGRTSGVIPDPVVRSLREGQVVSIPPSSELIRRDGTRRRVDDSAAPIRDAEGRIVGSVLVFRGTGSVIEPLAERFEILDIHLVPLNSAQYPLPAEQLQRLEQKCRMWLLRHWIMEENTVRIVPLDDIQVLIHQESAPITTPSGTVGLRFRVAYEQWSPMPAA